MNVNGKTVICGLIGDPVEHTMSPAMQNAAFRKAGLDYVYVPFRVKSDDVGKAIAGMRALGIRGLNVTIPHKSAVMTFLDRTDELSKQIGAVNTIVNDGGILTGYNTDAAGFLQPLIERGLEPRDCRVLVIGAGGAARAVTFALAQREAKVLVLNRTADRARELVGQLSLLYPGKAEAGELNDENLTEAVSQAGIVVNTTSVGMGADQGLSIMPAKLFRKDIVVYDIVYNPMRTKLIAEAEAAGCQTITGVEMLTWQGALAFEKWTGHEAPIDLMKEELLRHLRHED